MARRVSKPPAEDVDNFRLRAAIKLAGGCGTAASELQHRVRALGGDPGTSTSVSVDLHRKWVDLKSKLTGKDEEAVLNEVERGGDRALRPTSMRWRNSRKLDLALGSEVYTLVGSQYHMACPA